MGVKSQLSETDAQESATASSQENSNPSQGSELFEAATNDPFAQEWVTEPYDVESDTIEQILSLTIAIANIT